MFFCQGVIHSLSDLHVIHVSFYEVTIDTTITLDVKIQDPQIVYIRLKQVCFKQPCSDQTEKLRFLNNFRRSPTTAARFPSYEGEIAL